MIVEGLLQPLLIKGDGDTSEPGIRQKLGYDALPTMLDEFEVENGNHIATIIRLARSA